MLVTNEVLPVEGRPATITTSPASIPPTITSKSRYPVGVPAIGASCSNSLSIRSIAWTKCRLSEGRSSATVEANVSCVRDFATASFTPRTTSAHASSRLRQLVTGWPSLGSAWSGPNIVSCQSHARRMTGTTLAVRSWCFSIAFASSFVKQYSEARKSALTNNTTICAASSSALIDFSNVSPATIFLSCQR
jgi:hypothetical protein